MKSEHRHELKTNELGKFAEQAGQFIGRYANQIIIGLSAILLIAAIAIFWSRTTGASSTGWSQLMAATSAEDFADVADRHRGSEVGAWARLREAEEHLDNGIRLSFTDRAAAVSDLEAAEDSYDALLQSGNVPARVRERALFGMARTLETLSDGDTEKAITAYETLLKEFPDSLYKEEAQTQIADLRSSETKEFYAWFHGQNPKPADRQRPQDGPALGPGGLPGASTPPQDPQPNTPQEDATEPTEPSESAEEPAEPSDAEPSEPATPPEGETSEQPPVDESGSNPEPPPAEGTDSGAADESP